MTLIKVKVEQKHIDKGIKESPTFCPIALALRDLNINTYIGSDLLKMRHLTVLLPEEAVKFIEDFDDGKMVQPFEFTTINPNIED